MERSAAMAPASIGVSGSTSPATSLRPCKHAFASFKQLQCGCLVLAGLF